MNKMHNSVCLALYKGNGKKLLHKIEDAAIRLFTWGKYSHCEIAVKKPHFRTGERIPEYYFECYSASPREGGVRKKRIDLENGKWDLIELNISEEQVKAYFERTKGKKYDFWGALGIVLGTRQRQSRYFCSEWCYNVIFNSEEGHKYSPNRLAKLLKDK